MRFLGSLTLATYVSSIYLPGPLIGLSAWRLWAHGTSDILGLAIVALLLVATFIPLAWTVNRFSLGFVRFTCSHAGEYFPTKVIVEDEDSLKPGKPYILGFEPHSALPLGIPIVFASNSPLLPKALRGAVHGMASSVCFKVPFVRQLWWWLGLRPVSRHLMDELLASGKTVVLNPGGVQECLYMQHDGSETVFLRKRQGFVRMAMKHGAPLVPVFNFGQSNTYSWWRPKGALVHWVSRQVGAVPLAMWGVWGTPLPHQSPMTLVLGKPIEVPKVADPPPEEVERVLQEFIKATCDIWERHKVACGYAKDAELRVV